MSNNNIIILAISVVLFAHPVCAQGTGSTKKPPSSAGAALCEKIKLQLKAKKKIPQSQMEELARLTKAEPNNYKAKELLGDCYQSLGLFEQADEAFIDSMNVSPHRDEMLAATIQEVLQKKGVLEAEGRLMELQQKVPGSPGVVVARVTLMLARDNDWGATHMCNVWERTHKDNFGVATGRALVLCYQKKYKDALTEVEKDVKRRSDFFPSTTLKQNIEKILKQQSTPKVLVQSEKTSK